MTFKSWVQHPNHYATRPQNMGQHEIAEFAGLENDGKSRRVEFALVLLPHFPVSHFPVLQIPVTRRHYPCQTVAEVIIVNWKSKVQPQIQCKSTWYSAVNYQLQSKSFPSHTGPYSGADLRFCTPQPDTSFILWNHGYRLEHRMVWCV